MPFDSAIAKKMRVQGKQKSGKGKAGAQPAPKKGSGSALDAMKRMKGMKKKKGSGDNPY